MADNIKKYILKHKNVDCLAFEIDNDFIVKNIKVFNEGHLPIFFTANIDNEIKNNLYGWLDRRINTCFENEV